MDPDLTLPQQPKSMDSIELSSSVEILTLPEGIYSFTLEGAESTTSESEKLSLPALQIGMAPIHCTGKVELFSRLSTVDRWLIHRADRIVARIIGGDGTILLTSVRRPDSPNLSVNVDRLNTAGSVSKSEGVAPPNAIETFPRPISLRILAHIQHLGDLDFVDGWAGWPGQRLWIEGFALSSIEGLTPDFIEYAAILANGLQTPWLQSRELCGSRGGGMPLLGFKARLKPEFATELECLYRGRFISGSIVGPMRSGEQCSSIIPGDPLEALEIRIFSRIKSKPCPDYSSQ